MASHHPSPQAVTHPSPLIWEEPVKGADGEPMAIHEFVNELGALMRRALVLAIDLYQADPIFGTADYWENLVLHSAAVINESSTSVEPLSPEAGRTD
jgi:hypothetical protein